MKKALSPILLAGFVILLVSLSLLYAVIYLIPSVMDEYYNPVFRSSSFATDWLFYAHLFVLSISLYWFWHRFKPYFVGSVVFRALQVSLVYGVIAMLPVLWLTFSAIDISFIMVATWLMYGIFQSFVAGLVFAKLSP